MINAVDESGATVLHTAATHYGNLKMMKLLLAAASPELLKSTHKPTGRTILHCAAINTDDVVEQVLTALSPDAIRAADNEGTTVLHLVADRGWVELVKRAILPNHSDFD